MTMREVPKFIVRNTGGPTPIRTDWMADADEGGESSSSSVLSSRRLRNLVENSVDDATRSSRCNHSTSHKARRINACRSSWRLRPSCTCQMNGMKMHNIIITAIGISTCWKRVFKIGTRQPG